MCNFGFCLMVNKAFLPTTNLPFLIIGQGVADINIAFQTLGFWHIKLTLATFMPMFERTTLSRLLLHSVSCMYLPDDTPSPTNCTPPVKLCRQLSVPLDIRLGEIAVLTGIPLEPAPLYVLLLL